MSILAYMASSRDTGSSPGGIQIPVWLHTSGFLLSQE